MSIYPINNAFVFASTLNNIKMIDIIVHAVKKNSILTDFQESEIRLLLCESITNAIVHGNNNEAEQPVEVRFEMLTDGIKFIIFDQGSGFDLNQVPNPTLSENIEKIGGRGVYIIQQLCLFTEYLTHSNAFIFTYPLNKTHANN